MVVVFRLVCRLILVGVPARDASIMDEVADMGASYLSPSEPEASMLLL